MAGVFFTINPKHTDGARDPDWKFVLLPSLDESLTALSDGVKQQRDKYAGAIQRMMDLRSRITLHWGPNNSAPIESPDKFIDEVLRPYMQLVADTRLYFRLPPPELPESAAKQVQSATAPVHFLAFQWRCAFGAQKLLSGNIDTELCALLFNLGVLLFNRATATMYASATADACKSAFKDFQLAAGVWEQGRALADKVALAQLSFDIGTSGFALLSDVAIGMAHRCAYIKATEEAATKDNRALLSKLATTGARHLNKCYEAACALAEGRQVNDDFRYLQLNIKDNAALLEADGYLHVMHTELKANDCGAVIAKGRIAIALLAAQVNGNLCASASNKAWLSAKCAEVRAVHDEAQTFNSTVYFKTVPDAIEPLPAMERPLGKPTPLFADWTCVDEHNGQPFKGLVGPEIIPMLAQFREQITAEFGKLSRATTQRRTEAAEALQALQLDVILCQTEEGMKPRLPQTLRDRVVRLQSQAATYEDHPSSPAAAASGEAATSMMKPAQMLQAMLRHVANVSAAVEPVLQDAEGLLERDRERDASFLSAYGEKLWRQRIQPSDALPDVQQYRRRIAELRSALGAKVREPLQGIVRVLNENAQGLLRVGMPVADLDAMIPVAAAPTKEQLSVTALRDRLVELRRDYDMLCETEMQLLKAIPPLITAPETAAALCAAKAGAERDEVLAKKQVEFIDSFAGVQALAEQRAALLCEMEKRVTELAETKSVDPLFAQKAEVIQSVERGIQVVEGAVMRIGDVGQQAAQAVETANALRQYVSQLLAQRDVEARAISAQLDEQIKDQMSRMKSNHQPPPPSVGARSVEQPPQMQQQQQQQFNHNNNGFGMMQAQQSSGGGSSNYGSPRGLAPPPPPPMMRHSSNSSSDFDPFAMAAAPPQVIGGNRANPGQQNMDNLFGGVGSPGRAGAGAANNNSGGGAYTVPDFAGGKW